jgi:hypothetical protein
MLSLLSSAAATSARKRQPGPANSARKGQPACHCERTIGGILDMCSQDNVGSACWRTCCQACFAARDPLPRRYHNNVYHQAELAYAMVEAEIIEAGGLSERAFRGDTYHGKVQPTIGCPHGSGMGGSVRRAPHGDHMSLSSSAVPVVRLSLTFLVLSLSLSGADHLLAAAAAQLEPCGAALAAAARAPRDDRRAAAHRLQRLRRRAGGGRLLAIQVDGEVAAAG